jgi:aryl-alcohol dehydrogenase-like predicted oxidoreductase
VIVGAWAIGGWWWGETTDDDRAIAAIRRALDLGIRAIDTAPMYGCGHSEEVVGRALQGRRDGVLVATKCGLRWDVEEGTYYFQTEDPATRGPMRVYRNLKARSIEAECELSLRRLGADVIDLYQCHWPDASTPLEETMEAMLRLRQQGKIRAIGVSNFTPAMIRRCMDLGVAVASDQPEYSLLSRGIEADVLPFCRQNGIGVLAYSPLGQGLLSGRVTMERVFPPGDGRGREPWFASENRRRVLAALETIRPIADGHRATLAQIVIAWTIGEPGVTAAIVGARTEEQVEENAGGATVRLAPDERRRIREAFEAIGPPVR